MLAVNKVLLSHETLCHVAVKRRRVKSHGMLTVFGARGQTAARMDGGGSCCSSAGGGATPPKHMTNAVSQCGDRDANTALAPSLSSKVTQKLHSEHIFASAFVARRKGVDV